MNIILGYVLLNLSAFLYFKFIEKMSLINTILILLIYNIFIIGMILIFQGVGNIMFDGIFQHIKSR